MIKIIEGFYFEQDRNGFTLFEAGKRQKGVFGKVNEKSGEMIDYQIELGYYGTIQGVLEGCLKHATRKAADSAAVKQIGDYIEIMKQIADEIKQSVDITAF